MRIRLLIVPSLVCLAILAASLPVEALEPREVFAKAAPSVVVVSALVGPGKVASGSGVALRSDVVATNCHVVAAASEIHVTYDQQNFAAKLIGAAHLRDICLLRVSRASLRPVVIANPRSVQPGDRVYSIGSPQGLASTIAEGLVSGLRITEVGDVIQTSAAISPGSSGGGLFNSQGELIGVTTFSVKQSQNLNFAIPASAATNLLADIDRPNPTSGVEDKQALIDARKALIGTSPSAAEKQDIEAINQRLSYLRWLEAMSERLKPKVPDSRARVEFLEATWYESRRAGLEVALVLGVIETMSNFRKYAVSQSGSRGYMQVAPTWSKTIGDGDVAKLFHMQSNLRFGCVVLRHYVERANGDLLYALILYFGQAQGKEIRMDNHEALAFTKSVLTARARWVYTE